MFYLQMIRHEEVTNCYQSWELQINKVGIFAHKRYKIIDFFKSISSNVRSKSSCSVHTITVVLFYSDKRSVPGIDCFINGVPQTPSKIVKVFEISENVWPSLSLNTPQETEAFVRFMVHISRWKRRNIDSTTTGYIINTNWNN